MVTVLYVVDGVLCVDLPVSCEKGSLALYWLLGTSTTLSMALGLSGSHVQAAIGSGPGESSRRYDSNDRRKQVNTKYRREDDVINNKIEP